MNFESVFDYEKLWLKAKLYMQKALAEDRDSEWFPFWSSLCLEFLARATLANVHPVLLADPREGENLLYVFGFHKTPGFVPISVPTKTVLERIEVIVPNFTATEKAFCRDLSVKRNGELHSGELAFIDYPTKIWLSKYYKTLQILLEAQGKKLVDLLGPTESIAAEEMIKQREKTLEKTVKDRISRHKKAFLLLTSEEKQIKLELTKNFRYGMLSYRSYGKEIPCPACGNAGIQKGKLILQSDGRAEEDHIVQQLNILPTSF